MIEFAVSNTLLFLKLSVSVELLPMKCSTARLKGNSSVLQKQQRQRILGVCFGLVCFMGVGFAGKTLQHSMGVVNLY